MQGFPVSFTLQDGTRVKVYEAEEGAYEFHLTRLNSERHNFLLREGRIEESYETRFDHWQDEAVKKFQDWLAAQRTC